MIYTKQGTLIGTSALRVVSNDHPRHRGSFLEFHWEQVATENMYMVRGRHIYFHEWRTVPDDVMLYQQRRRVNYADYLPDYWYVSVADLKDGWEHSIKE